MVVFVGGVVNYDWLNIDIVIVIFLFLEKEEIRECFFKLSKCVIWDIKYLKLRVVYLDIM